MRKAMTEIIGNKALCERLTRDVASGKLSHAYIIEGVTGSGRKTIALNVAAATVCKNRDSAELPLPCLQCDNCRKVLNKNALDVIFIKEETKATVGVDIARFIREDVRIIPNDFEDKFYIIEDADKLTPEAQNALLLTLEEPPSFAHFFLISNNADNFLKTVRSRLITLRTQRLDDETIEEYICSKDTRAAQMKLASPTELAQLIKASRGGIGLALAFLDSNIWKPVRERRELISDFLSKALSKASPKDITPIFLRFSQKRDALLDELSMLAIAVRDLIAVKNSDSPHLEFYCNLNEVIELSDKATLSSLYKFYGCIDQAISELDKNANVKLLLTKFLLSTEIL